MTRGQTMRRIVLPQAMRVIIPPTGNEFISHAEGDVAGLGHRRAATCSPPPRTSTSANLKTIELLLVATFWYLVLTTIASARASTSSSAGSPAAGTRPAADAR